MMGPNVHIRYITWHHLILVSSTSKNKTQPLQALDNMLDDKNVATPLNLVAHGFITGQYAATWALAHPDKVAKLVLIDVPLSAEVRGCLQQSSKEGL